MRTQIATSLSSNKQKGRLSHFSKKDIFVTSVISLIISSVTPAGAVNFLCQLKRLTGRHWKTEVLAAEKFDTSMHFFISLKTTKIL